MEGGGRAPEKTFQAQEAAGVQARWLDGGERQEPVDSWDMRHRVSALWGQASEAVTTRYHPLTGREAIVSPRPQVQSGRPHVLSAFALVSH